MKINHAIATLAVCLLPVIGNAETRCGFGWPEGGAGNFDSMALILESKSAPKSAEDVTFDYSSQCPRFLSMTSHIGTFPVYPGSATTFVDIYGTHQVHKSKVANGCDGYDISTPPTVDLDMRAVVTGAFIYCVSHTPPGAPPPTPKNKAPSPPPSCKKSDTSTPNPVFLPTGEKYLERVDWVDQGPHPLTIKRTYTSHQLSDRFESRSWVHNYSHSLDIIGRESGRPNYVRILNGSTKQIFFKEINGVWVNLNGIDSLIKTQDGWNFIDGSNDEVSVFDGQGVIRERFNRNGWKYVYEYDGRGFLSGVTNAFGRRIVFEYTDDHPDFPYSGYNLRIRSGDEILVRYERSGGQINKVIYPDGSGEVYSYEGPELLTSISDVAGNLLHSFEYDQYHRAVATSRPVGADKYTISYEPNGVTVKNPLGTSSVYTFFSMDGQATLSGSNKPKIDGSLPISNRSFDINGLIQSEIDFLNSVTKFQWDANRRLPLSTTQAYDTPDARTILTEWHPQWRLPVKVTEVDRETSYTYDAQGNALTQIIKDTSVTPAQLRAWSWTYSSSGLVATETMPNGAVSSFTYDSLGNLIQVMNALGQADIYTHDGAGRVLTHTAATGLVTAFQYDLRGRMTRVQRGDQLWGYVYGPAGQLAMATSPDGYAITYQYDAAQRLTGWSDNRGVSVIYTLDGMGNRINESVKDAQSQAAWQLARTINGLNRVESITVGDSGAGTVVSSTYGYDANGDIIRVTQTVGGASQSTTMGLDALRRVKSVTNAQNASATLVYNARDDVTQANDFKSVVTSYTRDALGNAKQDASLDSGTLTRSYDSLGLPQNITDALGRAINITRDALGRPTQITGSLGGAIRTTMLRYDLPGADYNVPGAAQASVGSLSEIQDIGVTTRYQRDLQGRITRKVQLLGSGDSRSIAYSYVPVGSNAAGQVASITYPSGKQLAHQYDATGQLTGLTWAGQPLVANLVWNPLGQPTAWEWPGFSSGPGHTQPLAEIRSYTSAGQLSGSALLNLTWDSAGRISQIQQQHMLPGIGASAQQAIITSAYTYDPTGRLTASAHSGGPNLVLPTGWSLSDTIGPNAIGYAWDANGNLTQSHYSNITPAGTATQQRVYQTTSGTNRLSGYTQTYQAPGGSAQINSVAYSYDAAGALTKKGDNHLHYGIDGRIAKTGLNADVNHAQAVTYTYNILGQRIFKSDARLSGSVGIPATQQTVYAEDGIGSTVLGQYANQRSSNSAAPAGEMDSTEVIYLPTASGPMPIAAQINGRLYAIDSDHLNTPRRLTNPQGQVAWQWLITGFGEVQPTTGAQSYVQSGGSQSYSEQITFDLRYPGQQWDEETGLAYNLHRYYDAATGRYVQSDPIGLQGGWNRFGYVGGNPLSYVDPNGLNPLAGAWAGAGAGSALGPVGTVVGGAIGAGVGAWIGWNVVGPMLIKPPENAYDPNGPKAPGKPGEAEGFKDPKGGENWVPNPNPGRGGSSWGWQDAAGDVWCPSGQGGRAHGAPHWDVQTPGGGYRNERPRR